MRSRADFLLTAAVLGFAALALTGARLSVRIGVPLLGNLCADKDGG